MGFLFNLVPDNLRNAAILALARHAVSSIAGGLLVLLLANHATQTQATDISQGVASLLLGLVSYGCSLLDVKGVDTKIKEASPHPPVNASGLPTPSQPSLSDNVIPPPSTTLLDTITQETQPELPFVPVLNRKNHPFGDI